MDLETMTLLIAHIGHWWYYPLYAIPVIIVLASALMTTLRERRGQRQADGDPRRR
jgi:hypothetical protein